MVDGGIGFLHDDIVGIDGTGEAVEDGETAQSAAVAVMPGAFGPGTTLDMFTWVNEGLYAAENEEDFQRYHARRIQERSNGSAD